ncbi:MAG: DUF4410 domain-containing protein [Steroidobacteraceae bacterium]
MRRRPRRLIPPPPRVDSRWAEAAASLDLPLQSSRRRSLRNCAPLSGDSSRGTPADEAQVVAKLTASLSSMLAERGLAAAPAGQSTDLILRRVVMDVRSGNKLKRMVISLGPGQARL